MFSFIKKGVVGIENDKEKRKKEKKPNREIPAVSMAVSDERLDEVSGYLPVKTSRTMMKGEIQIILKCF